MIMMKKYLFTFALSFSVVGGINALDKGDDFELLENACILKKYKKAKELLESGLFSRDYIEQRANLADPFGCKVESVLIAQLLVKHGASMQKSWSLWGGGVLHKACRAGCSPALLQYYIKHAGLDINTPFRMTLFNNINYTPLLIWAQRSLVDFNVHGEITCANDVSDAREKLRLLIAGGADVIKDGPQALQFLKKECAHWSLGNPEEEVKFNMLIEDLCLAMHQARLAETQGEPYQV